MGSPTYIKFVTGDEIDTWVRFVTAGGLDWDQWVHDTCRREYERKTKEALGDDADSRTVVQVKPLFLWLLTPPSNVQGFDTYSNVVVVAATEDDARCIHPEKGVRADLKRDEWQALRRPTMERVPYGAGEEAEPRWRPALPLSWAARPSEVQVKLLGTTDATICSPGLILANYLAG